MADKYINELEINGQKRLDLTQDTATPETVLEGETFHLRSGAPATGTYRPSDEIETRLRATVGHSSKNLVVLKPSGTNIDVSFISNIETGIVTTSGTNASTTATHSLRVGTVTNDGSEAVNYWLSGCAEGGSNGKYYLFAVDDTTNDRPKQWDGSRAMLSVFDATTSVQVQIPAGHMIRIQVAIRPGQSVAGLTFKPMLREASISDDTFEPYQIPTDERIIDLEARVAALEAIINNR